MKKIRKWTLTFVLMIFSALLFAEEISLMSFNIAHNSAYKKEHRDEWISQIAEIVKDNNAQIVLLQEVPLELKRGFVKKYYGDIEVHFKAPQPRTILNDIADELGKSWKFFSTATYLLHDKIVVDGIEISAGDMSQNNAILYDSSKFIAEDMADTLGFTSFPDCDYRFNKNNLQVVRFTDLSTKKTFVIGNVHLQSKNSVEKRNLDLENLADMMLNEFGGELSDEPIVMGGDFNTNRWEFDDMGFFMYFVDGGSSPKTTLSTSKDRFKYANDFDHFIYNQAMKSIVVHPTARAIMGDGGRNLEKVKTLVIFGKEFKSAQDLRERLSDHVPVVISFDFEKSH